MADQEFANPIREGFKKYLHSDKNRVMKDRWKNGRDELTRDHKRVQFAKYIMRIFDLDWNDRPTRTNVFSEMVLMGFDRTEYRKLFKNDAEAIDYVMWYYYTPAEEKKKRKDNRSKEEYKRF